MDDHLKPAFDFLKEKIPTVNANLKVCLFT